MLLPILTLFTVYMHFFALSFSIYNMPTNHVNFLAFDNDDIKPSKRQVSFIPLIFLLKHCLHSLKFLASWWRGPTS